MKDNLISVILPIWSPKINELKKSIDSVLSQTYPSFELIIVYRNHPETDSSFHKLIDEYDDKRIRIIQTNKKGVANAMNIGIINSTGNIISRIDGDDFWSKDKLQLQLEYKDKEKLNIVGSWGIFVSNEGKEIEKIEHPVEHNEIRKYLILNDKLIHSSILMDKKILEDIGLYNESFKTAEDYEMWFRIISKGYKFGNIPKYLVTVGLEPESISRSNWQNHRKNTIKAKNMAILKYGFNRPRDFLYYLPSLIYYFISEKNAKKIRKILGISR